MDYIRKRADRFVQQYIHGQVDEHDKVISEARNELYDIYEDSDKVTFLQTILEGNEQQYQKHLLKCTNIEGCPENYNHESINYYLRGELIRLGIPLNEDQFTHEERDMAENKLDQILEELKIVKAGQEILYEDLKAELEELKNLYVLGKKNWHQLLLGKTADMVMGGVISETVSKEIVTALGKVGQGLIS